ncbi:MAG: FkbM family methyltransferase [Ramlibacter sp.]
MGVARGAGMLGAVWRHPGNRGQRLRAISRLLAWQFVKHVLRRPVVISFHTKRLKCYPDSTSTSAALYFSGYPDYWEMKFLQAYLKPGDNFLDIGANSGVYSILAAACIGAAGHVDAFEPADRTATRIEEQAALNDLPNLHVHRLAVCDQDCELEFGFSDADATMHLRRPAEHEEGKLRVKGTRLDTFEPYRQYAAGKIDIEGAEPLAFAGAAGRLRDANPPVWLLELAGYSTLYGVSSDEVLQRLADAGYDCAIFNPESNRLEFTTTPWLLGVQNVLAISRQHVLQVCQRLARNANANHD